MKTFNFRIVPLATEVVEGARRAAATGVKRSRYADSRFAQFLSMQTLLALGESW